MVRLRLRMGEGETVLAILSLENRTFSMLYFIHFLSFVTSLAEQITLTGFFPTSGGLVGTQMSEMRELQAIPIMH